MLDAQTLKHTNTKIPFFPATARVLTADC